MKKKEYTIQVNGSTTTVSSPDYHKHTVPTGVAEQTAVKKDDFYDPFTVKIHHPEHYNKGIECWDYIISHNMGFLEGNIIKYITRYKLKNGRADLLKAKEYLDKLLEEVK
jgi:hypothetical protein